LPQNRRKRKLLKRKNQERLIHKAMVVLTMVINYLLAKEVDAIIIPETAKNTWTEAIAQDVINDGSN